MEKELVYYTCNRCLLICFDNALLFSLKVCELNSNADQTLLSGMMNDSVFIVLTVYENKL